MNIVEPIIFQAKINPHSIAICTPGTRMDFVTYAGLAQIIDSLGRVALSLGLARGDVVGWSQIGGPARLQVDTTTTGWVAGGGIEKMFGRHWSARAEFLHYGFGKKSVNSTTGGTYTTAFRHDVSVVRLGVNFRP